jgi:hypothetical protein
MCNSATLLASLLPVPARTPGSLNLDSASSLPLRVLKMPLQLTPTLLVVIFLHLLADFQTPLGDANHETTIKKFVQS